MVQLREAYEFVTRYNGHAPFRATKVQRQPNGQHLELVSWPSSGPQEDCDDSCAVETDDEAEELQAAAAGVAGAALAHCEGSDLQAVDPGAAAVVAAALDGAAGSRLLVFKNCSGGGASKLPPVQQFQSAATAALSNITTGAGSLTGCTALTAEDAGCVTSSETKGQTCTTRRDRVGSGSASPPPAVLGPAVSRSLSRNRSRWVEVVSAWQAAALQVFAHGDLLQVKQMQRLLHGPDQAEASNPAGPEHTEFRVSCGCVVCCRLAEGLDASGRLVKVRKLDDDTHVVYTQLG